MVLFLGVVVTLKPFVSSLPMMIFSSISNRFCITCLITRCFPSLPVGSRLLSRVTLKLTWHLVHSPRCLRCLCRTQPTVLSWQEPPGWTSKPILRSLRLVCKRGPESFMCTTIVSPCFTLPYLTICCRLFIRSLFLRQIFGSLFGIFMSARIFFVPRKSSSSTLQISLILTCLI